MWAAFLGRIECIRCRLLRLLFPNVCLFITWLRATLLCKRGWTDWGPACGGDFWGSKEHCIRWGSKFPPQILCGLCYISLATCLLFVYFLGCIECMQCSLFLPTVVASVCQSGCLSVMRLLSALLCKNGWTDHDTVWGEHTWGPMEHCVRRGSWSLHREGVQFNISGLLSAEWLKLETLNFACT